MKRIGGIEKTTRLPSDCSNNVINIPEEQFHLGSILLLVLSSAAAAITYAITYAITSAITYSPCAFVFLGIVSNTKVPVDFLQGIFVKFVVCWLFSLKDVKYILKKFEMGKESVFCGVI